MFRSAIPCGDLPLPQLPYGLEDQIHGVEPSGAMFPELTSERLLWMRFSTSPEEIGSNGSPSIFVPHAREVALGLDYWIRALDRVRQTGV